MPLFVGCAGWAIRKERTQHFSPIGSHLQRYTSCFNAVEINSSFYKPHRPATYAKWAQCTPEQFKFSVKIPKEITHTKRLIGINDELAKFLSEAKCLDNKLGPFLIQLPPSLDFNKNTVNTFFASFRNLYEGHVVCEPRHISWFTDDVENLLKEFRIARVAADPAVTPAASKPGGWDELRYFRLHGSPRIYYSSYEDDYLVKVFDSLLKENQKGVEAWCIFDNTALGAATENAICLLQMLNTNYVS